MISPATCVPRAAEMSPRRRSHPSRRQSFRSESQLFPGVRRWPRDEPLAVQGQCGLWTNLPVRPPTPGLRTCSGSSSAIDKARLWWPLGQILTLPPSFGAVHGSTRRAVGSTTTWPAKRAHFNGYCMRSTLESAATRNSTLPPLHEPNVGSSYLCRSGKSAPHTTRAAETLERRARRPSQCSLRDKRNAHASHSR